jgi:hypothetical protein
MTTRNGRDKGLATVRKATIWIAGGAVVAVGAFAALFGQPTAGAKSSTAAGGIIDGASPSTTSTTRPRSGSSGSPATATTTPRSSATTPATQAPSTSRRRPRVSSGGS